MPKPIKTRTYYNFMRVCRAILGKGYTPETAEEITRRIFDAYEQNSAGLPIWEHVRQIVPASDENGEHTPANLATQAAQNAPQGPKVCQPYLSTP